MVQMMIRRQATKAIVVQARSEGQAQQTWLRILQHWI